MRNQTDQHQTPAFSYAPDGRTRPNAHAIRDKAGNIFYFSYAELVAFTPKKGAFASYPVVIKNYWGVTTGKHLNWIDGGGAKTPCRVSREEFTDLYRLNIEGMST